MNRNEIIRKLSLLPKGYISKKIINGKEQYYLQWTENGKKKSKYINIKNLDNIKKDISQRKKLEAELKKYPTDSFISESPLLYLNTNALYGSSLKEFVLGVKNYKKRNLYKELDNYLYSRNNKVFILYGLRRTGKTTLIKQAISDMSSNDFNSTAFIHISSNDDLSLLNKDIKQLINFGYKYIFIDEVTLMKDFIEGAALFSDIYTESNIKIILSGTDSLGFAITKNNQLYDRCILCHTTFIPYKEFENVLGIKGIDNYIQYGGTMSISGNHYNDSIFSSVDSTDEYIDSSIAKNIQHSLKNYQNESHFRNLYELYKNSELTNAINRIIEDMNHRFTKEVITKEFISNDLSISSKNLRNDINEPNNILDNIDIPKVTKNLKSALEIIDKNKQKTKINDSHVIEIQEYLNVLELTYEIPINYLPVKNGTNKVVFTQPGLRYCQANALIANIMKDSLFSSLNVEKRTYIINRILNEIKGRMMEDIVLLETSIAKKDSQVFKLQFAIGEYDMLVVNENKATVDIYEVKHSSIKDDKQIRFLTDTKLLKETEFRYGKIVSKNVIYNGKTTKYKNINYINVEEYLLNL